MTDENDHKTGDRNSFCATDLVPTSAGRMAVDLGVWLSWVLLFATLIVTAGLVFFGTKWRYLFLGYVALTQFVYVPLSGMNIETGLSMALRDLLSMLFGALIVIVLVEESQSKTPDESLES